MAGAAKEVLIMKCGIYTRVSTNNQVVDGESLDEQEKKLINYCELKNWNIVKIYREEGVSAKNLDRPKFKELIRDIEERLIDTIVIKKSGKWYAGYVKELPGAHSQGKTIKEVKKNLREAILLILDSNYRHFKNGEKKVLEERIAVNL